MTEHGVRVGDLKVEVTFPSLRLDSERCEDLGRYVQELDLKVFRFSDEGKVDVLGELKCFLFDAISADQDEEQMFPEPDYDGEPMEFYEFLFSDLEFIRGRLLHLISPENYTDDDEDDENWELCNALCVSRGWWRCRPEVLIHVFKRLHRTLKFSFVCIDSAYVKPGSKFTRGAARTPIVMPHPFKKAVWGETCNPDHLVEDARKRMFWISFVGTPDELNGMSDEAPAQLGAVQ